MENKKENSMAERERLKVAEKWRSGRDSGVVARKKQVEWRERENRLQIKKGLKKGWN